MRHTIIGICCMGMTLLGVALPLAPAHSQPATKPDPATDFPRRSVRLIVPNAPGGGTDVIARMVGAKAGEAWGQSVVIDNQGGGGTTIGTSNAVRAAPDGYTLLMAGPSLAYVPALYRNLPYDTEKDLLPIMLVATQPSMLVVHPSLPVKSLAQLVALAKSKPGALLYSSGGTGSPSHLAVELLRVQAGIKLVHVPYKGGGPAGTAALTGETQMTITNVSSLLAHVRSGRLRALAVTGTARAKAAPELPTVAEAGLPGYEFGVWYGLLAPAKTPQAVVRRINDDFNRALSAPDLQDRFAGVGIEAAGGTPQQFTEFVAAELRKWAQVIATAGIKGD